MDVKELTLRLAAADGPSGAEDNATALMAQYLEPYGKVRIDPLGNLLCTVRPAEGKKHHYVLDAHSDEIGMIVTHITDEGFLKVSSLGGVDRRMLTAAEVVVHGKQALPGVVGSTPPHLQEPGEKKNPKVEDILIDIGMDKETAKANVSLGDRITFKGPGHEQLGGLIVSKALDDRSSCAAIIRAVELLKDVELDCGLSVAFAVQEETGMTGAKTSCYSFMPTHCFSVDVTFANTPDLEEHARETELGKGPSICYHAKASRKMTDRTIQIAKAHDIPVQINASGGGSTGTNATQICTMGEGVAVCCVGIPLTYMHTPVEQMNPEDIENTARLIAQYLIEEEGHKC